MPSPSLVPQNSQEEQKKERKLTINNRNRIKMGKIAEEKNWKGRNTDMIDVSKKSIKKKKVNNMNRYQNIYKQEKENLK